MSSPDRVVQLCNECGEPIRFCHVDNGCTKPLRTELEVARAETRRVTEQRDIWRVEFNALSNRCYRLEGELAQARADVDRLQGALANGREHERAGSSFESKLAVELEAARGEIEQWKTWHGNVVAALNARLELVDHNRALQRELAQERARIAELEHAQA